MLVHTKIDLPMVRKHHLQHQHGEKCLGLWNVIELPESTWLLAAFVAGKSLLLLQSASQPVSPITSFHSAIGGSNWWES